MQLYKPLATPASELRQRPFPIVVSEGEGGGDQA